MADTPEAPVKHERSTAFKLAVAAVPGIMTILGGVWAIDNHYASAADIQQVQQKMETQVVGVQRSLETQVRSLRQERADDEIFKLEMKKAAQKGKLSPEDSAMLERFLRRSAETNKEQRASDKAEKLSPTK